MCLVPKDTENCVIIRPRGQVFVPGLALDYNADEYPEMLLGRVDEKDFKQIMNELNCKIKNYAPCYMAWMWSYLGAIPSLGLSLFAVYFFCI